jgi:hypothetical protein
MAHHGDDPFAQFPEANRELLKQFPKRRLEDPSLGNNEELGATGRFPQGKLNDDDAGELQFGVAHTSEKVVINFGKPIAWVGMDPDQADAFAQLIVQHAMNIRQGR